MTDQNIFRQDQPHEVKVTEGSQVAASRSLDPQGPQVRKTLAGETDTPEDAQADAPELPAPVQAAAPPPSAVFERNVSSPAQPAHALPAASAASADPGIVFERSIQDDPGQAAPPSDGPSASDGNEQTLLRAIQDRFEEAPAGSPAAPSGDPAPVLERSMQDHRLPIEALAPGAAASDGPSFDRSLQDRFVPLPASAPAVDNVQFAPPEGSSGLQAPRTPPAQAAPVAPQPPELPPVPTVEALAQIQETAQETHARVEETLGAADQPWVEMDFPARLIRLKIENDKVRTRLDQLEAMAQRA